jgi:hypothetical protein
VKHHSEDNSNCCWRKYRRLPLFTFSPETHQTLAYPYKVRVHVRGNFEGKEFTADIGGFDITQRTGSWW